MNDGAPLCLQPRPHLRSRMRVGVILVRHRSPNLRPECRIIATRQLDAVAVPSAHYVSNNRIYFKSHRLAGTNAIAIDLMTMK